MFSVVLKKLPVSDLGDLFIGGTGNATLQGGLGVDTISYADQTDALTIDLGTGSVSGHGSQVISGFEALLSGSGDDELAGSSADETIDGGAGNDTIAATIGNDTLIGGADNDTLTLFAATSGVTVDLSNAGAQAIGGGLDNLVLSGFENVIGTNFDDKLTGGAGATTLSGGSGNDTLYASTGDDLLLGRFRRGCLLQRYGQ